MGEVYVGWDETLERRVALKAIRHEHRLRSGARARFLREARLLSQLDHPNICRIYDYREADERDFLVLELIEGESLHRAIVGGRLDAARRLTVAEQVARALAAAHAKGVVHRDLKPQNVMLATDGTVKVLDFGIARSVAVEREPAATGAEWSPETALAAGAETSVRPPASAPPADGASAERSGEAGSRAPEHSGEAGSGAPAAGRPGARPGSPPPIGDPGSERSRPAGASPADGPTAEPGEGTELLRPAALRLTGPPGASAPEATADTPPLADSGGDSWTLEGTLVGSPGYISPEQARGEPATTASDMYAFGLLLQELFTGRSAHPPDLGVAELVRRARHAEHLPLTGVRSDVAALAERLLDPAPAARPTAVEALARLRWIRDKPRRRLIRGAIAAGLLLLALGGAKYTLDLRAARDQAERHRAQAEDLIGFMLGDLRDKLSGVGRLELLEDVGDKALAYFASLPTEDRTDDEIFRRSKALRQIAEVRIAQGDLPAAMEVLDESERLAEGLVARDPRRAEWLLGLAHSHFWKGNVHWLQGDLPAARARFTSYLDLADRLATLEPDETEWRLEQGYAETNLAAVHEALGDADPALAALDRSLAIKQGLVRRQPDNAEWRRSLANGLSWQGSMLTARGDLAGAAASFAREREMRQALLAADPQNAGDRVLLAVNSSHTGNLALLRGDLAASGEAQREARDLYLELVERDPDNSDWRRDLAVVHLQLAELDLVRGDLPGASRSLGAGRAILAQLVAQDPSNGDWRRRLARAGILAARAGLAAGRPQAALAEARQARSTLEELAAAQPDQQKLLADLAASHLVLGQALAATGESPAAQAAWERAAEILRPLAGGSHDVELLALEARTLLHLGRLEEAGRIVLQLTAAGYAQPDLLKLCAGYGLDVATAEARKVRAAS